MVDDVAVRFGADIGPMEEGGAQAKGVLTSLKVAVQSVVDAFLVLGGAATGSFREIRTGATEAGEKVKGVTESVKATREAIVGMGEALIAVFALEQLNEWAHKMAEAGENTEHMAQRLGMSVPDVQRLGAMATMTGGSLDQMGLAAARLDRAFAMAREGSKQQELAFRELGVSTARNYTQMELLRAVSERLSGMADGPAKAAIAMQLLGRSGSQLIPLFDAMGQNWDAMSAAAEKYGVINEDANAKAASLAEAFDEQKVAMSGLGNTMAEAFAPALEVAARGINDLIAGFVKSYQQGGAAKSVMDALVLTFKALADAVALAAAMIKDSWDIIDGAAWIGAGVIAAVIDGFIGGFKTAGDAADTFGRVLKDVFTLNWGAIAGDIHAGFSKIAADVVATAHKMGQDAAAGFQKGVKDFADIGKTDAGFAAFTTQLFSGKGPHGPEIKVGRDMGDTSGLQSGKTGKGADEVAEWRDQLQQKIEAEKNFFGDSTAEELAFWQSKIALTKAGSKERIAVDHEIYTLEKQQAQQQRSEALSDEQADVQSKTDAEKAKLRAVLDGIAEQESAVRAAAQRREIRHAQEYAQLEALEQERTQAQVAAEDRLYRIALDGVNQRLALYATDPVNYAKTLKDKEALEARHQQILTGLVADGERQRLRIEDQAADQAASDAHRWIDPVVSAWGSGIKGMIEGTTSFRQALANIGSAILSDAIGWIERKVAAWIVGEITQTSATAAGATTRTGIETVAAGRHIALKSAEVAFHGAAEIAKTAATAAGTAMRFALELAAHVESLALIAIRAIVEIGAAAARAAANAFAAIAAIPIVGPFLAPGAAAAAFAAVIAFGKSIASAAGGWDKVPYDGAITELHKDEMVLPASIASPLRSMVSGPWGIPAMPAVKAPSPGASGASTPSGAGDRIGDVHFHIQALDTLTGAQWIRRNRDTIASELRDAFRNGAKVPGMA